MWLARKFDVIRVHSFEFTLASGVAESGEYLLVEENAMADGILLALEGKVPRPKRRTWEEYSEKEIYKMFDLILSGRI